MSSPTSVSTIQLFNIIMTPLLKLIREMWTDVDRIFVISRFIKVTKSEKTN